LEIRGNNLLPGINLVNLVEKVEGSHTEINNDLDSIGQKLNVFVQNIVEQFQVPNIPEKTRAHVSLL